MASKRRQGESSKTEKKKQKKTCEETAELCSCVGDEEVKRAVKEAWSQRSHYRQGQWTRSDSSEHLSEVSACSSCVYCRSTDLHTCQVIIMLLHENCTATIRETGRSKKVFTMRLNSQQDCCLQNVHQQP